MRYVTISIRPEKGGIHPVGTLIAQHDGVVREKLLHVDALFNGNGVLFYRLRGDVGPLCEELADHPDVIAHDVIDTHEGATDLYIYVRPGSPAGTLMYVAQKYALIIDTPLEYTDDGRLLVTVAGTQANLRQAYEEFPDSVDVSIEQAGDYAPGEDKLLSALTDRQREVLQTAVDMGYYTIPREATHNDIAAQLGVASSTIDEHLRKAESRLFTGLLG
ncbi:helix-turn-helix domain-containing protein [Halomarina litorea]|uniref:helix-turn-helix domain-containing protein n=1 Tax=Halomarina litorea TaxID=2961595 RepID=UPI0020C4776D|nr:helix-turn-helix domain-containing protein [Halomarina sp. BCD28]